MKSLSTPVPLFDTLDYIKNQSFPSSLKNFVGSFPACKPDYEQALLFLQSYRGSEATFNSYRREVERLLHWSWHVAKKSIRDIKRTDLDEFLSFCQNPPTAWIALKQASRFINKQGERTPNEDWRPFMVRVSKKAFKEGIDPDIQSFQLSQNALQAIFSVLSSFYNFLIVEEYAEINPVAQIRQKSKYIRKKQTKQIIRRLSELQWSYVIETAEILATKEAEKHERTLFVMNALYGMYLRISELVASDRWQPKMGDFRQDLEGNWWFTTVGKGNKERAIAVSNTMLEALKRYRQSLGLTEFPTPGETTPLLTKQRGRGAINTTRQVRKIVQFCFDTAIARLRKDDLNEEAENLMSATVHWLRHTGISDDVKFRPREHVRDDAGHGSSAITDRYIDIDLRERHRSAKGKVINPNED